MTFGWNDLSEVVVREILQEEMSSMCFVHDLFFLRDDRLNTWWVASELRAPQRLCDHSSGDNAVRGRMPMPEGRSRHQLIHLPRHFHLSGLTACITHPSGRAVCLCVHVLAGEMAKDPPT